MMYYSIWLTIIVVGGVFVMTKVVKSCKYIQGRGRFFTFNVIFLRFSGFGVRI